MPARGRHREAERPSIAMSGGSCRPTGPFSRRGRHGPRRPKARYRRRAAGPPMSARPCSGTLSDRAPSRPSARWRSPRRPAPPKGPTPLRRPGPRQWPPRGPSRRPARRLVPGSGEAARSPRRAAPAPSVRKPRDRRHAGPPARYRSLRARRAASQCPTSRHQPHRTRADETPAPMLAQAPGRPRWRSPPRTGAARRTRNGG